MGSLHRQGPGDPRRLTGIQGQEQASRLEVGAADRVDHAQADPGRPADVDPREVGGRDLFDVAPAEAQAAKPQHEPSRQQGGQGTQRRAGQGHAHLAQDRFELGQPLVDVPADQELHGRPALQLEGLGGRGERDDREVRACRVGASPRIGQGVGQSQVECRAAIRAVGLELQRQAVEQGRSFERQGLGGLIGRPGEVDGRPFRQVRAQEVRPQHLGIGLPRGLEDLGQAAMMLADHLRLEPRHDGLANPVMVGLDLIRLCSPRAADQSLSPQQGQRDPLVLDDVGRLTQVHEPEGTSRYGEQLEHPPRLVGESADSRPEHLIHGQPGRSTEPHGRGQVAAMGAEEVRRIRRPART